MPLGVHRQPALDGMLGCVVVCMAVSEVVRRAAAAAPAWMMCTIAKSSGGGGEVLAIMNAIMPSMQALEPKSQAGRTSDSGRPRDATTMYTTPKK